MRDFNASKYCNQGNLNFFKERAGMKALLFTIILMATGAIICRYLSRKSTCPLQKNLALARIGQGFLILVSFIQDAGTAYIPEIIWVLAAAIAVWIIYKRLVHKKTLWQDFNAITAVFYAVIPVSHWWLLASILICLDALLMFAEGNVKRFLATNVTPLVILCIGLPWFEGTCLGEAVLFVAKAAMGINVLILFRESFAKRFQLATGASLEEKYWTAFNTFLFYVFSPALLFNFTFSTPELPEFWIALKITFLVTVLMATAIWALGRRRKSYASILVASRNNTYIGAFLILSGAELSQASGTLIVATQNVVFIEALVINILTIAILKKDAPWQVKVKEMLWNPGVIAILLGLLGHALRLNQHEVIRETAKSLAFPGMSMVIIAVGAWCLIAAKQVKGWAQWLVPERETIIKLFVLPASAFAIAYVLMLSWEYIAVMTAIAATISSTSSGPTLQKYCGDVEVKQFYRLFIQQLPWASLMLLVVVKFLT